MTEIYAEIINNHLVPINAHFAEELDSLPRGKALKVKITQSRSLPHNSLYFVCINAMVKAGVNMSRADLHNFTKIKCGFVRIAQLPNGDLMAFPDSTAFDKLDQIAFNEYFKRAVEFWRDSGLIEWIDLGLRDKIQQPIMETE